MADAVEPSPFTSTAEIVILAIWFVAAIAPVVIMLTGMGRNSAADTNIYLRLLGLIWLGPMSIAIVGMGANYARMVVETFKAFRS